MLTLTVDVNTTLVFGSDYYYIDVFLYRNETKQTYSYITAAAAGTTPSTPLRTGEIPGLERGIYTLIVKLLDANFSPVAARMTVVSMIHNRVTRVSITRR